MLENRQKSKTNKLTNNFNLTFKILLSALPSENRNFRYALQFAGNVRKERNEQGLHAASCEGGTSGRCIRGRHDRANDLNPTNLTDPTKPAITTYWKKVILSQDHK